MKDEITLPNDEKPVTREEFEELKMHVNQLRRDKYPGAIIQGELKEERAAIGEDDE